MELDTLATAAGLTSSLAVVPPDPHTRAPQPAPPPGNPAAILATLMDFSGGVAVAELLQGRAPDGPPHPEAARRGRELQERVHGHLDALSTRALQRQREPAKAELTAAEIVERIARAGGPARAARPEAAQRLGRELRDRLGFRLGPSLRQAQTELVRLRASVATELRALGPRAGQLERIDAALHISVHHKLAGLYERVTLAAEQSFDRACRDACASLPDDFGEPQVAAWLAPGGFIARHVERCERTTAAFCLHLRRGLEGLVHAAIQAEVGS